LVGLLQFELHLHLEEVTREGEASAGDPFAQNVDIGLEKRPTVSQPVKVGSGNEFGEPSIGAIARRVGQRRNGFGKIAERRPDFVERPLMIGEARVDPVTAALQGDQVFREVAVPVGFTQRTGQRGPVALIDSPIKSA
jgi:hypothetical protein